MANPYLSLLPSSFSTRRLRWLAIVSFVLAMSGVLLHLHSAELYLTTPWTPTSQDKIFASKGRLPPPPPSAGYLFDTMALPLRVRGRHVVDSQGCRFRLASLNWYGASDELFVPGGLDIRHRRSIARTIRDMGFNSVRLPYSDELVYSNPIIPADLVAANPDLAGKRALDVFVATVEALTEEGIAVIVNNHITVARWCCDADPCDSGWSNTFLPPGWCRLRQSEDQWIDNWLTVMARLRGNRGVIGADLRNEVRGLWGTMPWSKWAAAAERAGNALLAMQDDWLIIVGGTESNNDLSGVAERPIRLVSADGKTRLDDRVVYSSHVYSWSGWGSTEGRYARRSYASFARAMRHNWAYLVEGDVAPVWVGEFGAPHDPGMGDANYWANLLRYLKAINADFGYWAINPRKPYGNTTETYGLVQDDWETPVLDYRLRHIRTLINGEHDGEDENLLR